ncbi:hypothetical protein [Microbacterium yannicii]|uniref:hypothetical protein n=1 Tax=Microbacterium yannicii TaxID=671622 RepID=UPI001887AA01|nr:hypothetical protein [Microbacterium yannicii]MCO5952589.1 hypothetical protein [Microbacterium yannicii]
MSDTSPNNFNDGPAYGYLRAGECDVAAGYISLDRFTNAPDFGVFQMKTPRYVVLLSAGVAMCRAAFDEARASYSYAMDRWGTQGLDHPDHPKTEDGITAVTAPWRRGYREPECDLYRALTFSLTGVAADSLQCPGGLRPLHHYVKYTTVDPVTGAVGDLIVWDNPLTFHDDESLTPPEHWNQAPGIAGTNRQIGPTLAGDPDDEFDFPERPPGDAPEAPTAAAALDAAEVAAPTAPPPAESAPIEPAAVEPAGSEAAAGETGTPDLAPADAEPTEQPEAEASVSVAEPAAPHAEPTPPAEPTTPPALAEPPATPPAESEPPAPAAP